MLDARASAPTTATESPTGRLGPLTFPSLIHDLCEDRQTGVLSVQDGDAEKSVYIDTGRIVFATSNEKEDRLGSLLIKRGMVSVRAMEEADRIARGTGKRLGGALVDQHLIRPQDLVWGVREQVKEIVIGLFHWTRGTYRMDCGPLPTNEVITLKMSTGDVILEGVRRVDSWVRIQAAVGGLETRYKVSPRVEELGRAMTLSLEEWTLLSRCEGPVTLADLCEATPMKDFDVCRLVWAFAVVGMLQRLD